jgi:hypothetical protein
MLEFVLKEYGFQEMSRKYNIALYITPPRASEIIEKNWSPKAKSFVTSKLEYKAKLKY